MFKLIITGILGVSLSLPIYGCIEEDNPAIKLLNRRMTDKIFMLWVNQGKLIFPFNAGLLYYEAKEAAEEIIFDNYICKEFYGVDI